MDALKSLVLTFAARSYQL